VQFVSVGEEFSALVIPPPLPIPLLPEKLQFVSMGEQFLALVIPPAPPLLQILPRKLQFVSTGDVLKKLDIPPPVASAKFPEKLQLVNEGVLPLSLFTAPP
jgi:hypothetical protein